MADTEDEDFTKAFENFGEDDDKDKLSIKESPEKVVKAPETPETEKPVAKEEGVEEPAKKPEEAILPAPDDSKKEEVSKPAETPETPTAPEAPQALTKDDVKSVVSDLLNTERSSGKELETATNDVLEKYYPSGLSNTLVDEKSGKELKTPQDVVDASGGEMTIEAAASWLLNEQYKLDNSVKDIKDQARGIAETTLTFKRDAITAVQKYEPLFKAYPSLQQKVWDQLLKQVKVDKDKDLILSAPDVMDHYDFYLEAYQKAYEFSTNQPATAPVTPPTPEVPKPSAEDRMDEGGDGGTTAPNDPNDFAQQVSKELAKGI